MEKVFCAESSTTKLTSKAFITKHHTVDSLMVFFYKNPNTPDNVFLYFTYTLLTVCICELVEHYIMIDLYYGIPSDVGWWLFVAQKIIDSQSAEKLSVIHGELYFSAI